MLKTPSIPAAFFGMILGLVGLGGCWREAARIWNAPAIVGEPMMAITAAVWAVLVLLYIAKWIWRRAEAVREIEHPVQCCFVGLLPVSTMLLSVAALPYSYPLAAGLGIAGGAGQLGFATYRTGQLWTRWQGSRDAGAIPAYRRRQFCLRGRRGGIRSTGLAALLFGAGLLAWFALESVLMHRF